MDKANRNFDDKHATKDAHGNITAKHQHGLAATGKKRKKPARIGFCSKHGTIGDKNS